MAYTQPFAITVSAEFWANVVGGDDPSLMRLINGPEVDGSNDAQDTRLEEVLRPLLDQIPAREADIFELRYFRGKTQDEIGYIFGLSQAGVWHLLERSAQRLRFLSQAPTITDDEIRTLLTPHFEARDVEIMVRYRATTNQSLVAKQLKITQGAARHRILKGTARLERIAAKDPLYRDVARLYTLILEYGCVLFEFRNKQHMKPAKVRDESFA